MARLGKTTTLTVLRACFGIIVAMCVFAKPSPAAEREQGIMEIQIKDHRDAIGDFAKLKLTIDNILISPKPGLMIWQTGWKEIGSAPEPVDLTQYVGKKTARIFRGAIDAGSFDAFHVKFKKLEGLLKKKQRPAPVKNNTGPVKLSFDVKPQGETILILDLVVTDMSDHPPRGYELEIRGLELFTNGKLIQKIPPA
jgi:hypothetical protein